MQVWTIELSKNGCVPSRDYDCRCVAFEPILRRAAVTLLIGLFEEVGRNILGYGLSLESKCKPQAARPRKLPIVGDKPSSDFLIADDRMLTLQTSPQPSRTMAGT